MASLAPPDDVVDFLPSHLLRLLLLLFIVHLGKGSHRGELAVGIVDTEVRAAGEIPLGILVGVTVEPALPHQAGVAVPRRPRAAVLERLGAALDVAGELRVQEREPPLRLGMVKWL